MSIEIKFNARGFTTADGILAKIISKNKNIKKILIAGKNIPSYLASDGKGNYAHGKTIVEATQELSFKTGKRDISQFKNMSKDTKKTPEEWAFVYRMITGACRTGIEHFMQTKDELKAKYTLAEIIEETKGAYGHEVFIKTVSAA